MMSSRRVTNKMAWPLGAIVLLATVILVAGLLTVLPGPEPGTALAAAPAPTVVSVSPANNATNCPITQTFTATFDEEMDPATINAGTLFMFVDTGTALAATVTYDVETKTATLVPKAELVAGKTYYVTLTINAKSTAGVSVAGAPLTWTFHTLANTPPRVVSKAPADGAVNCPLNQVMSITFDSPMNPAKFTPTSFYFAKRGGAVLPATIAYDAETLTATLTPLAELEEATVYDISLIGTATGINGMFVYGAPIVWSFTTVLVQPPAVASKSPTPGATDQPLDVQVTVTFDRAIDKSTVNADSFYLQKVGGDRVECVMTANESGTTLTPKSDLEPETTYQVTLSGAIKSPKGATLLGAPVTWTFTTEEVTSPFSDVATSYRYFQAIYELSQRGAIGGYADGKFRPSSTVTRQQYAKMIVKALGLTVTGSEDCPFGDVADREGSDPLYPARYVAVCAAKGIIQGKTAKLFAPYDNITRHQAVTMVVRAVDSVDRGLLETPDAGYASTWNPALSPTHGANARLAEFNGLLAGLPLAQLDPTGPMTRGEIAQLLWNLVKLLEE